MSTTSFIKNLGENDNIFKHYGVTLTMTDVNGVNDKIFGIHKDAFSIDSSFEASPSAAAALIQKGIDTGVGGGTIAETLGLTSNMASTANQFKSAENRQKLSPKFIYMPGFLGQTLSFKDMETMFAKWTHARRVDGMIGSIVDFVAGPLAMPYGNYYYKETGDMFKTFATDSYKNDFINVTLGNFYQGGGFYATAINRAYSAELDKYGKPIYCEVTITLEHHRGTFADELPTFFK